MISKIVECCNGFNWGKFQLIRYEEADWNYQSEVAKKSLLRECGWDKNHLWVLDLQTGEGAFFRPGGYAVSDLEKHKIWVCLLYSPFLEWLYKQDLSDITKLPSIVKLPDAPSGLWGYRREGK